MVNFVQSEGGLAQSDVGDFAFVLAFVGAPWAAGLTIRLRREREAVLGAENERLPTGAGGTRARAVAEERSRIARELHDVVSHAIAVTVLQARGARRTLDTDPAAARAALDAIEQTNTAALGDMRRLLAVLRDTEPDGRADDRATPRSRRWPTWTASSTTCGARAPRSSSTSSATPATCRRASTSRRTGSCRRR